jgi:ABC-type maltose transport system permease subunit
MSVEAFSFLLHKNANFIALVAFYCIGCILLHWLHSIALVAFYYIGHSIAFSLVLLFGVSNTNPDQLKLAQTKP